MYDLKPRFQSLLRPFTRWLARHGITANQVTLAAALASLAVGVALASVATPQVFLLLPFFLFVRMALNAIDGMLAREHGQQSRLGALLNEITDVVSDAALYLPFALIPGMSPGLIVILVLLAAISEMTGVIGLTIGASRRYDGPLGKSDRAFLFGLLGLLIGLEIPFGNIANPVMGVAIALLLLTIVRRARSALEEGA